MKGWKNLVLILFIIAIFILAYIFATNPYGRVKKDRHFMGNEDGSILIIEVGDYLDPMTAATEANMQRIRSDYEGDVKFIYTHYDSSELSRTAAMAAECAGSQKDFIFMHKKLFDNYLDISLANIYLWANEIGLKDDEFRICMENEVFGAIVDRDFSTSKGFNARVLPIVFINGERFDGLKHYTVYQEFIDSELSVVTTE